MKRMLVGLFMLFVLCFGIFDKVHAGPVIGGSDSAEATLKNRPDIKPVRPIGPVNMSNGIVLPPGKVTASLKYRYVHKDDLYDGGDEKSGTYNGKYDRVNQTWQLAVKAGLFDDFEMRVMVPFHLKRVKRNAGNPPTHMDADTVAGLGDVVVMGRYALLSERSGDWLNLAVGAGLALPTGDADHKNPKPFSKNYEYMGPGAQLGTGSFDPKFELGATKFLGRSRFDAHLMLTFPGEGAHGSRKGNQYKCDVGYSYALNRSLDIELELNGVYQAKHIHDASETVNTGGTTVFLTPGVHWKINERLHFSLGVPIVIYRDLNGESADPEFQSKYGLGENIQIVGRLGLSF